MKRLLLPFVLALSLACGAASDVVEDIGEEAAARTLTEILGRPVSVENGVFRTKTDRDTTLTGRFVSGVPKQFEIALAPGSTPGRSVVVREDGPGAAGTFYRTAARSTATPKDVLAFYQRDLAGKDADRAKILGAISKETRAFLEVAAKDEGLDVPGGSEAIGCAGDAFVIAHISPGGPPTRYELWGLPTGDTGICGGNRANSRPAGNSRP